MQRMLCVACCLGLAMVWPASAQDIVVMEYGKCEFMQIEDLRQQAESVWLPAAQELVNEGKLSYVQVMEAEMADEWNIVWYYRAKDYDTFWSAYQEWGRRVTEKHPNAGADYNSQCSEWKRFLYKSTVSTAMP